MAFVPNFDSGDEWSTLYEYSFDPENQSAQPPLGRREPRSCRFCLRTRPAANFKNEAHLIPAAFGNRALLHLEECNDCNDAGSQLEDALCSMLAVARATSRIRTRTGPIKYRFGKAPSYIEAERGTNTLIISKTVGDDTLSSRFTRDGIAYDVRVPRFWPMRACKALARMGYFVAPEENLPELNHVREWIAGARVWLPTFYRGFVPGPGLIHVTLILQRHRDAPVFRVIFVYSSEILVIHLPDPSWQLPANLTLPFFALSEYSPHVVQWTRLYLGRDDVVPPRTETIRFHVPAIAEQPAITHEEISIEAHAKHKKRLEQGQAGTDVTDWLEAEQLLLDRRAAAAGGTLMGQVTSKP
jgi:hypothetical protein